MKLIIRFRYIILGLFVVLFALGVFLIPRVVINYDGTSFLPANTSTRQALVVMEEEFGNHGACEIMVQDVSLAEAGTIYGELQAVDGVMQIEFLPNQEAYYHDNIALYRIIFDEDNYDKEIETTLDAIKTLLADYDIAMRGESINATEYNNVIQSEIINIVLIIVPIVLVILFLATTSWIEPILFIIVVLVSVIINMGSNAFFPSISYMTHATCGILQLALCMDYTVMMLHAYKQALLTNPDPATAVRIAGRKSFIPIVSSMFTTIAGFVALLFMRYRIGFDVGIVLIKGTLLSFISTFLLMPGLIVMFAKLIEKSKHRSIFRPLKRTYTFLYKTRFIMPILALLVIGGAFVLQLDNQFIYSENKIVYESPKLGADYEAIKDEFGYNNQLVILVPNDLATTGAMMEDLMVPLGEVSTKGVVSPLLFYTPYTKAELSTLLTSFGLDAGAIAGIGNVFDLMQFQYARSSFSILEMVTFIGETELIPAENKVAFQPFIIQMTATRQSLESDEYYRIIITTNLEAESEEAFEFVDEIKDVISSHFSEYYLLGESVGIVDIKNIIDNDYWKVTLITIALIFIIVLLSFGNLLVPALLIILIMGATWMNMAIPALFNNNLLYLGYIIVSCIMLGATIDYAILYTHHYRENRLTMGTIEAMEQSFHEAKHTIFTSGLILVGAGFTLGWSSSIPSIAAFGTLIGRGAITSMILVLFVLPQTLLILDRWVTRKQVKS